MTSDERRVKKQGGRGAGEQGREETPALTRAMGEWKRKLEAGYTIRPRFGRYRWGPGLFNPEGAFVQSVRRDTYRRLLELGIFRGEVSDGDHS